MTHPDSWWLRLTRYDSPLMWYAYSCSLMTHMTGSPHVYILGSMCPLMHRSYSLSLVCAHQYFHLSLAPRFVHFCKPSATPTPFNITRWVSRSDRNLMAADHCMIQATNILLYNYYYSGNTCPEASLGEITVSFCIVFCSSSCCCVAGSPWGQRYHLYR